MHSAEKWAENCLIKDHPDDWWIDPTDAIRAAQDEAWNEAIAAAAKFVASSRVKYVAFDLLSLMRPTQGKDTEG